MKKRIISLVLVVVILALTLTSCAYRYESDDLSKYVKLDQAKFEEALKSLKIEDGDFTNDNETREKKLQDQLLNLLVAKLDTSSKIKETTGVVDGNDVLYYCYYYTAVIDGVTRYFSTSLMKPESAVKLQLGLNFRNDASNAALAEKIAEMFEGKDIEGQVYDATTSGTATSGKLAFVSYTVEYREDGKDVKETHEYELVTLGDENNFIAKSLAGKTIGTAEASLKDGDKTYTNATVNLLVNNSKEFTISEVTYTTTKSVADIITEDGSDKKHDLKDVELTYHIFPVYRVAIPEFNAETLMDTLYSNLTSAGLECLEDKDEDFKALDDLIKVESDKKTAYDNAEKDVTTKQTNYDNAKKNLEDKKTGATEELVNQALEALETAKTTRDTAKGEYDKASKDVKGKRAAIIEAVGADKLVSEFKKVQYKSLLDAYNREIKNNLAKAIYEALKENSTFLVTDKSLEFPKAAIQQAYDNRINSYKYEFYEGTASSDTTGTTSNTTTQSNYSKYGTFENYLCKKVTQAENYTEAKHVVWWEAIDDVSELMIIYNAAQVYGVSLTGADITEFKENYDSSMGHYMNYALFAYYGYTQESIEESLRTAVQFDKLMNSFLETEGTANENGGEDLKYTDEKIKFEIVESAEK